MGMGAGVVYILVYLGVAGGDLQCVPNGRGRVLLERTVVVEGMGADSILGRWCGLDSNPSVRSLRVR